MSGFCTRFIIILLLFTGCTSKSHSELNKALAAAVKDQKISNNKMRDILQEHEILIDRDDVKAREYGLKLLNVIEMGGDSTHIDLVRKQILRVRIGV